MIEVYNREGQQQGRKIIIKKILPISQHNKKKCLNQKQKNLHSYFSLQCYH